MPATNQLPVLADRPLSTPAVVKLQSVLGFIALRNRRRRVCRFDGISANRYTGRQCQAKANNGAKHYRKTIHDLILSTSVKSRRPENVTSPRVSHARVRFLRSA